jgi:LysM repeat protein
MRRGRHEFRLTVWTFVAPVALVVAVLVVLNIAGEVVDSGSSVTATLEGTRTSGAEPQANAGSEPGTTTGGPARRRFYTIKPGDTLSAIAAQFDTTEEELQQLNPNVDALALVPGQRLRVS